MSKSLKVKTFKEGQQYIAYIPGLKLYVYSESSKKDAMDNIKQELEILYEEGDSIVREFIDKNIKD